MNSRHPPIGSQVLGFASLLLAACGGGGDSGSGSGVSGTYTSVNQDAVVTMEFESGGGVSMTAAGLGSSRGTFTVEGEKLIVSLDGRNHTFIRDGDCIQDQQNMFGQLCKGGRTGEASNGSTPDVPTTPTGTYLATNADGEFRLEFKSGNTLTLTATPAGGGAPDARDGRFTVEGRQVYATLSSGDPMVLTFVNDGYESTSFGLPMRFVKQ
jgi:hypothetical protein